MSARPRLSRDAVLRAALTVIDEAGLEACTMRAVAAELGVEAMSLYWHVPGKDALLDGVVGIVLAEVAAEESPEITDWRAGLSVFAHTFRSVVLRHPNVVPLLAGRPLNAYAAAATMAERGIARLEAAGFDRATSLRVARSVARYVVGFTLSDADRTAPPPPPTTSPRLDDLLAQVVADDPGELFTFGLELMLDGLEARLRRA